MASSRSLSLILGVVTLMAAESALACEPAVATKYFEDRAPGTNFKCIRKIILPTSIETGDTIACGFQYTVAGVNDEKYVAAFQATCGRRHHNVEYAWSDGAENGGFLFFLTGAASVIGHSFSAATANSKIGKAVALACDNQVEILKQLACDDDFVIVKPGTSASSEKKASSSSRAGKRKGKGE